MDKDTMTLTLFICMVISATTLGQEPIKQIQQSRLAVFRRASINVLVVNRVSLSPVWKTL